MNIKGVFSPVDALVALLGQHNGVDTISDTVQRTSGYYSIQVVTDTVFNTLTEADNSSGSLTGITIPAGTILMGEFLSIKLTSGVVRAYKV